MTHKTWPPPVGTLLILTNAANMGGHPWQNGDVLQVVEDVNDRYADWRCSEVWADRIALVHRLRDAANGEWWAYKECVKILEETDNDQT